MHTVNNKFDIGEECYSVYRKPTHYKCPICEGNGKFPYKGYEIWCKNCNGSGKVTNDNGWKVKCPRCDGTGGLYY